MPVSAQPYLLAIFAGIVAILVNFIAARFNNDQTIAQKQWELRVESYAEFLEEKDSPASTGFRYLLRLSSMVDHIATDGEIQTFEDTAVAFLEKHDIHELHWQFISASAQLQLHGSPRVIEICNDIQRAILQDNYVIDWSVYPPEITSFHKRWKVAQEAGSAYGTEDRISGDDRLMIATVGKLAEALVRQLHLEVISMNPTRLNTSAKPEAVL